MVKATSRKTTKKTPRKGIATWLPAPRQASTLNDVKTALLLVSLTINVALFIGWLALRLTTVYDQQVYNFLFSR